jgi:hypothetical protein
MSGPHRVVLSDFKAKKSEEDAIDIVGDDGETYRIPPPALWPDSAAELAEKKDSVGVGRLLLGEDRYEQFVTAGGGSANLIAAIIQDELGVTAPES